MCRPIFVASAKRGGSTACLLPASSLVNVGSVAETGPPGDRRAPSVGPLAVDASDESAAGEPPAGPPGPIAPSIASGRRVVQARRTRADATRESPRSQMRSIAAPVRAAYRRTMRRALCLLALLTACEGKPTDSGTAGTAAAETAGATSTGDMNTATGATAPATLTSAPATTDTGVPGTTTTITATSTTATSTPDTDAPSTGDPGTTGTCDDTGTGGGDLCPPGTCKLSADGPCEEPTGPLGNACCGCACGFCSAFCRCAAPGTPIATPTGERPIAELRAGDLVYSIHRGEVVAVPLRAVHRLPAPPDHVVLRIQLADGGALQMSPGHPTADGRDLRDLVAGDRLGDATIAAIAAVPYTHAFTHDILPDSDSGVYFAAGAAVGSTLHRAPARCPAP